MASSKYVIERGLVKKMAAKFNNLSLDKTNDKYIGNVVSAMTVQKTSCDLHITSDKKGSSCSNQAAKMVTRSSTGSPLTEKHDTKNPSGFL